MWKLELVSKILFWKSSSASRWPSGCPSFYFLKNQFGTSERTRALGEDMSGFEYQFHLSISNNLVNLFKIFQPQSPHLCNKDEKLNFRCLA